MDILVPFPGEVIVTVGFGGSLLLERLAATPAISRVSAFDSSRLLTAFFSSRNRRSQGASRIDLVEMLGSRLPSAANSIDAGLYLGLRGKPELDETIYRELYRVLRAGGRLVVVLNGRRFARGGTALGQLHGVLERVGFVSILGKSVTTRTAPTIFLSMRRPL